MIVTRERLYAHPVYYADLPISIVLGEVMAIYSHNTSKNINTSTGCCKMQSFKCESKWCVQQNLCSKAVSHSFPPPILEPLQ